LPRPGAKRNQRLRAPFRFEEMLQAGRDNHSLRGSLVGQPRPKPISPIRVEAVVTILRKRWTTDLALKSLPRFFIKAGETIVQGPAMTSRLTKLALAMVVSCGLAPADAFAQGSNDPLDFEDELIGDTPDPPYMPDRWPPDDPEVTAISPYDTIEEPLPKPVPSNASDFFSSLTPDEQLQFAAWAGDEGEPVTMGYLAVMMDWLDAEFDRQHLTPEQRTKFLREMATDAGIQR
jgi:hypothetical protein